MDHAKMAWVTFLCWVLAGSPGLAAPARDNPATGTADRFFWTTNLYTFHLTIAPDQWAILEQLDQFKQNALRPRGNNEGPDGPFPGPPPRGGRGQRAGPERNGPMMMGLKFKKGIATLEFEGQPCGAIDVRFKGNSSFNFARNSLKRSLKLDFNGVEKGRTFFGLTKLNLNNNAMDPSQMQEALGYDILRHAGVPAGRTAFAKVFITVPGQHEKAYAGLYTVVEQVDSRFLKSRFGAKEGMLLKPERIPGLPYLGDDWAAYTNRAQAKTEVKAAESTRFVELVKCLNLADDPKFEAAIADLVDVDEYLRFLAVEGLLSNLDSPLMTGHNYFLYLHPKTHKFVWVPWDLNEAFGGFFPGGNATEQMDLSLDHGYTRANRLAERLLKIPAMKARYHQLVRGILATNFNAARLFPLIDAIAAVIRPALANDPMVRPPQFEAALSQSMPLETVDAENDRPFDFRPPGPGGPRRPKPPIKAFIKHRVESAQLQLEGKANGYEPREMRRGPGGPPPFGPAP